MLKQEIAQHPGDQEEKMVKMKHSFVKSVSSNACLKGHFQMLTVKILFE